MGQSVAVRSNETGSNRLTYLAGDHHGTQSLAISADATQTISKRYTTPFGAERGMPTGTAWPDDKGFLGKTNDRATGLTHIGARQYDADLGQFISVDPILDASQPHSLNGYSYASNSPVTLSDPTGLNGVGGGNPGTPGNSGSKKPYGGALGGYEDAPSGPYPMGPVSSVHISGGGGNYLGAGLPSPGTSGAKSVSCDVLQGYCTSDAPSGVVDAGPDPLEAVITGLASNVVYAVDGAAWLWDDGCWGDGGWGQAGCGFGPGYDEQMAESGVDTASGYYIVPGVLASVFAHKPMTKSGKPTYGDRKARDRKGSITGKTTTKTHWARVEVTRDGQMLVSYSLRSGSTVSGESQSQTHTEIRVIRMSGTTSMDVNGDPCSNLTPIKSGDTVTIHGRNPPCRTCQASMRRAAQELGATFVYRQGKREWSWGK